MMGKGPSISPFTVLLLSAAAALVGLASLRLLHVQYLPQTPDRSIRVSYSMPEASARIVAAEVTSKLEGVLSGATGCTGTTSVSKRGGGRVTVRFRRGTDMAVARFDVASRIRNVYGQLPEGVSYPDVSLDASGQKVVTAISYELRSTLPTQEMARYAQEHVIPALSRIRGVDKVEIHGVTPYQYVVTFDADRAEALDISASTIAEALKAHWAWEEIGLMDSGGRTVPVSLVGSGLIDPDFGRIPVCCRGGRIVHMEELASWRYEEAPAESYFRVNGLNTVTLDVSFSGGTNILTVSGEVRRTMASLARWFPQGLSARICYDASEYVSSELRKIVKRTVLCLVILLLLVFLSSLSLAYVFTIGVTLLLNLLLSLSLYALFGLDIHIYTLAGISVSLGIIIDTTIIMVDHYRRYRNRKVFPALLGATATTVAALSMTLLLPETERQNLTDFIWVIILNLTVSLAVAWFFVPALLEKIAARTTPRAISPRRRRAVVRWSAWYRRYMAWGIRHRWVFVLVLVAGFGIPTCLIPREAVKWRPYADNKTRIDRLVGSSFALFHRGMDRVNFYREPEPMVLSIRAGMLEGSSVAQLDTVVRSMENFLATFEEIDLFTTSITSYDDAAIDVYFKKETESTDFPWRLKSEVTAMAINFGGASWRISGVDDNYFNNNVVSTHKSSGIVLTGYNFDALLAHARTLQEHLSANKRVEGPEIRNVGGRGQPAMEYNLSYDFERMGLAGIAPKDYYGKLVSKLYRRGVGRFPTDQGWANVTLCSSDGDVFDLWHVMYAPVAADSVQVALSVVGNINKQRSGLNITRKNQSYELEVAFDFIGSYAMQRAFLQDEVTWMNQAVLPVGYRAEDRSITWFDRHRDSYLWLILLMIVAIYAILSVVFESFRLPLPVLLMIPVSFIGVFLVFGATNLTFDQGGFAAFVMLCGLTVNAGIYLLKTWKEQTMDIRGYVRAFNLKIIPILLTVVSTILGLLPFLSGGSREVFWFDFAIGTMAGLLMSLLAIIFVLPVFAVRKP